MQSALDKTNLTVNDIDAVAVTSRPGLLGSLLVGGVSFAKGFAASLNLPLYHHRSYQAHLYASQIEHPLEYPYLGGVLVSGGHTVICRVDDYDTIESWGGQRLMMQ